MDEQVKRLEPIKEWMKGTGYFSDLAKSYNVTHVYIDRGEGFPPEVIKEMDAYKLNGIVMIGNNMSKDLIWGFYKG